MADAPPTDDPDDASPDEQLTPADVAGLFDREPREVSRDDPTDIERLLQTPTRVSVLATLATVPAGEQPMTVAEIAERAEAVTKSSFSKHKDDLLTSGVLEVADKIGGTTRYQLAQDHPVAQAWSMLVSLSLYGRTPELVDERFLGAPDAGLEEAAAAEIDAAARGTVGIDEDVVEEADGPEDLTPADVLEDADGGA